MEILNLGIGAPNQLGQAVRRSDADRGPPDCSVCATTAARAPGACGYADAASTRPTGGRNVLYDTREGNLRDRTRRRA